MNVLLIYPKFPDTFWSFKYALSFIGKKAAFPPLGLLTVAALLPDEFQKRLVDVNVDRLTDDDLSWADLALHRRDGGSTGLGETNHRPLQGEGFESYRGRTAFYCRTGGVRGGGSSCPRRGRTDFAAFS